MTNQQGAPEALAGCTRSHPHENMDSACRARAACPTCNDRGAVGNILTAEPCPDCTPKANSAPASVAGPMQFGGCPECGSRSCVARQCSRTVSHAAQAVPGVQWQCGPQASGFTAPQADSQPALPEITAEDRSFLHYNPNTDDIVEWVHNYASAAITADRAARAPADSVTAPAAGAVAGPGFVRCSYGDGGYACCEGGPCQADLHNEQIAAAPTPAAHGNALTQAARDVLAERQRQVKKEGWTRAHDDEHADGSLAAAAACYAIVSVPSRRGDVPVSLWPKSWSPSWWKPSTPRRNLIKAGALILAELERIDRAARKQGGA